MKLSTATPGLLAIAAMGLLSCAHRRVAVPGATPRTSTPYWIDLQPGWRVRVVTPILKSGGYLVKATPAQAHGAADHVGGAASRNASEVTLSAGPDFIGYEVSFYRVKARRGGGVRVAFSSAETHQQGHATVSHRPTKPLFQLPRQTRWVRILHLIRVSPADHDAAILGADRRDLLDRLTRQVRADPSACKGDGNASCSWVPLGIAVVPERPRGAEGEDAWVAVE